MVLLLLSFILWNESRSVAPVVQEIPLLASGCITRSSMTYDCFAVNPPLVRLSAALLVPWDIGSREEYEGIHANESGRYEFVIGQKFTNIHGRHTYSSLKTARLIGFAFLAILHVLFVLKVDRRLLFVALPLLFFSPTFLGHSATIINDVPAAVFGFAAIMCYQRWLDKPNRRLCVLAGIVLGLAELCKFTLLVFYPLFIVMWILYRLPERKEMTRRMWTRQGVQLAAIFLVSVYVINCGYLFEGTFKPLKEFKFQTTMFTGFESLDEIHAGGANRFDGSGSRVETLMGHVPMPLPANMIQGIDTQRYDFERGVPSYLRGEHADYGWWYYYLYALLVKMPLGTWGLLGTAIVCTLFLKGYNASWRDEMMIVLPGLTLFVFVSSQTGFSVHSRYIIPALPFLFIWISKVGRAFTSEVKERNPRSTKYVRAIVVIFLTWTVASSLWIYPHSLSYFNELAAVLPTPYDEEYPTPLPSSNAEDASMWQRVHHVLDAGPRNGPRHLLDSNIDWGQDLFYLEDWCETHPEARPMRVAYWGSYPLELSKVNSEGRPPIEPTPGWYALSVNELYGRSDQYRWFLNYEPTSMAGYSIYIYHVTLEDANRVRRELGLPELTPSW